VAPAVIAGAALAGLLGLLLWIAAGPLTTNDLWWHLRHGEAYASEGLWLERDPCLHTAEQPPVPHQWLFAVTAHGVDAFLGLHGLRLAHGLAALGIAFLALSVFRRARAGLEPALLATAVFLVLSWYRVVQLRPELFSIAAALALVRLLFVPGAVPSWGRVAAAVAVVWIWANTHTVFMVGPLLMLAALGGLAVQAALARLVLGAPVEAEVRARAARIAAALALSLLAALANPRGIDQHLAFVVASQQGAIFTVLDEWARFDPFAWTNYAPAVSALAWGLTDLLLLGFVAAAAWAFVRFLRAPSADGLRDLDPVGLALGAAGLVAMVVSIRFFWLSVLPLAALLGLGRGALTRPAASWAAAAASLGLAVAYPLWGGWSAAAGLMPREPARWLAESSTGERFFEEGIRFLEETGVEGNLFNTYEMGGYLCYRLAPRLRTFLDGSMNVSDDVQREAQRITSQRGAWPFETWLELLDRRGVDVFFGVGVPASGAGRPGEGVYTTVLPERAPGWRLISRGMRHGIWLRATERNRENLARVAGWYETQGVPFDRERGLDPARVIAAAPDWAAAHQLVPPRWRDLLRARDAARAEAKPAPFEPGGLVYALAGAYEAGLANDREAARLAPDAKAPHRRLVWALLRLDRAEEAVLEARELHALDPQDPRTVLFARGAQLYQRASRKPFPAPGVQDPVPPDALINALPLVRSRSPLRQ
jgi:hypothetical protein